MTQRQALRCSSAFHRNLSRIALALGLAFSTAYADVGAPEKADLKLGFIKLTDMAPLAIAQEKGFFKDEGLNVTLAVQPNWQAVLDNVISGQLDGSQMLAGQSLAASVGFGTQGDIVTPFSMDLNGNAVTVSNNVWAKMKVYADTSGDKPTHPIQATALKKVLDEGSDPLELGMVYPTSTHNYELRYWLASGGINPGFYAPAKGDNSGTAGGAVTISVTPPPQMPASLEQARLDGYCVGEPWNQQAIAQGVGVPVITDYEIWKNNPEKVLGVTQDFATKNPNTTVHLVKALIRAAYWLDENNNANRNEAVEILARPEYVGAKKEVIANSMTGTFEYEKGDKREVPDFNVFFRYNATYPYYSDAVWFLTQMRRWGQIGETKDDAWYDTQAKKVYRPDIYQQAATALIAEGKLKKEDFPDFASETGYKPATSAFIDGMSYDGKKPNEYINGFKIGLKKDDKV